MQVCQYGFSLRFKPLSMPGRQLSDAWLGLEFHSSGSLLFESSTGAGKEGETSNLVSEVFCCCKVSIYTCPNEHICSLGHIYALIMRPLSQYTLKSHHARATLAWQTHTCHVSEINNVQDFFAQYPGVSAEAALYSTGTALNVQSSNLTT